MLGADLLDKGAASIKLINRLLPMGAIQYRMPVTQPAIQTFALAGKAIIAGTSAQQYPPGQARM
jgi:hypothetical protein